MPAAAPSARFSVSRNCISSSAVSIPSRLTISSVNRKTPVNAAAPRLHAGRLQAAFDIALHPASGAPHVDDHPGHRGGGDDGERAVEPFLIGRVEQQHSRRAR